MGLFGFGKDKAKEEAAEREHQEARRRMEETVRRRRQEAAAAAAAPAKAPAASPPAAGAAAAGAGATAGSEYTVKSGDSLSKIARQHLGDANKWRQIYDANRQVIGDNPDLIKPGQRLRIPAG